MSENNSPQFDAACRILTVSSSLAGAKAFINRLKALSIEGQLDSGTSNDSDGKLSAKTSEENIIPWTIVNRYYVADVHFAAHVIHGISPEVFDKPHTPPAVIYVWVDGEAYVKHVEELAGMMSGYEPEVSLAVRIPKSDETAGLVEDSETERENNADIDTVLMSHGFEYIDATGEVPLRRTGDVEDKLPSTDDIPHLPRVLDALSTIMWPSMKSGHKRPAAGGLDNQLRQERDSILEELLSHDHGTLLSSTSDRDSEDEDDFTEQMQELLRSEERKAKGNSEVLKVSTEESLTNSLPWLTGVSGKPGGSIFSSIDGILLSPTDEEVTFPFGMKEDQAAEPTGKFSLGFEDDFTVFVSAPAVNEAEMTANAMSYHKTFESPMSSAIPSSTLEPGSARMRYHSLGSMSDFGGSDVGDEEPLYESLDDEIKSDDDDLPTKEEIREMSAKIFGTVQGEPATVTDGSCEDSDGEPPFDLSQVMSTLEQFKSDISGMDNEEERRKTAARVALGLLYGFEL